MLIQNIIIGNEYMTVIDLKESLRATVKLARGMTSYLPQQGLGMAAHVHVLRSLPIECLAKNFKCDH